MSDGNIILATVKETDDHEKVHHLFKCHKSVLGMHSPVFQNLFTLPQGADAEEYDGLPVAVLPDAYEDVRGLLLMLYNPTVIPGLCINPGEWEKELSLIEGPLRLAVKYELEPLRARLAGVLQWHWPSTWSGWNTRKTLLEAQYGVTDMLFDYHEVVKVINLARDARVPAVLPAAFYALQSTFRVDTLKNVITMQPSYIATGESIVTLSSRRLREILDCLQASDLAELISGREWLRRAYTHLIEKILPAQTRSFRNCNKVKGAKCWSIEPHYQEFFRQVLTDEQIYNPLHTLDKAKVFCMDSDFESIKNVCLPCRQHLASLIGSSQEWLWSELPFAFGLEIRKEGVRYGWAQYLSTASD